MKICSIESCNTKVWAYGYCSKHGQRYKKYGNPLATVLEIHGMRNTPEYRSWVHMKDRCLRTTDKSYPRYGGRGITICDRWVGSFINFFKDMGLRPDGTSLDRIDNNGNYEPSNCRWATVAQQSNNRRSCHNIYYEGRHWTMKELSNHFNINYDKLRQRILRYNWTIDKAIKE